jgi:hypothetical protein
MTNLPVVPIGWAVLVGVKKFGKNVASPQSLRSR